MQAGEETWIDKVESERAYRADGTFILSVAPWLFAIVMAVECASHWRGGDAPLLIWPPAFMAAASVAVAVAVRKRLIAQRYPDGWLLLIWLFMVVIGVTHTLAGDDDSRLLSQLVIAVTVVASGGLILPTIAGVFAQVSGSLGLFFMISTEYPDQVLEKAVIPLGVASMGFLIFVARRWAIRQSLRVRKLDKQLAESLAETEAARRVVDNSMRIGAGFAHHFNNQLQSALIGTDGIRPHFGPAHPAREWLDIVDGAIRRGIELTAQLVRYSRPVRLQQLAVSGSEFIAGLDLSDALSPGREVIRVADDVRFNADGAQLEIAITELVRNADASMPDVCQPVRLELRRAGAGVEILVSDSGHGIAESVAGRLTEPFVTGDRTNRFGLGLAVVAEIVRLHRGELSHGAGQEGGTVAAIRLPLGTRAPSWPREVSDQAARE